MLLVTCRLCIVSVWEKIITSMYGLHSSHGPWCPRKAPKLNHCHSLGEYDVTWTWTWTSGNLRPRPCSFCHILVSYSIFLILPFILLIPKMSHQMAMRNSVRDLVYVYEWTISTLTHWVPNSLPTKKRTSMLVPKLEKTSISRIPDEKTFHFQPKSII